MAEGRTEPERREEADAVALAGDGLREDLAANGGGVQTMAAEGGGVPEMRPEPADLGHQMAGIGHLPRPGGLDLEAVELRIGAHHGPAQLLREIARVGEAGRDLAAPEDALAALDQAVVVAGAAV